MPRSSPVCASPYSFEKLAGCRLLEAPDFHAIEDENSAGYFGSGRGNHGRHGRGWPYQRKLQRLRDYDQSIIVFVLFIIPNVRGQRRNRKPKTNFFLKQSPVDARPGSLDGGCADGFRIKLAWADAADDGIAVTGVPHVLEACEQQRRADSLVARR